MNNFIRNYRSIWGYCEICRRACLPLRYFSLFLYPASALMRVPMVKRVCIHGCLFDGWNGWRRPHKGSIKPVARVRMLVFAFVCVRVPVLPPFRIPLEWLALGLIFFHLYFYDNPIVGCICVCVCARVFLISFLFAALFLSMKKGLFTISCGLQKKILCTH